eukprot:3279377-Amphidinium_carterae.2
MEERVARAVRAGEEDITKANSKLCTEEDLCQRMTTEGQNLIAEVHAMEAQRASFDTEQARRESAQRVREETLEHGIGAILHEMAEQVRLLSIENEALLKEVRDCSSERDTYSDLLRRANLDVGVVGGFQRAAIECSYSE